MTKIFNLQSGPGYTDRVAFYVQDGTRLIPEDVVPEAEICYDCTPQYSYQVLTVESPC